MLNSLFSEILHAGIQAGQVKVCVFTGQEVCDYEGKQGAVSVL